MRSHLSLLLQSQPLCFAVTRIFVSCVTCLQTWKSIRRNVRSSLLLVVLPRSFQQALALMIGDAYNLLSPLRFSFMIKLHWESHPYIFPQEKQTLSQLGEFLYDDCFHAYSHPVFF